MVKWIPTLILAMMFMAVGILWGWQAETVFIVGVWIGELYIGANNAIRGKSEE